MRTTRTNTRTAGFSLLEIMAVLVIIAILMVVLLPRLMGFDDTAKEKMTGAFLGTVDLALGEYEGRFGDYPPSQYLEKWGPAPNTTNVGAEALVVSLWSPEWSGTAVSEDRLVNTDADETRKQITKFSSTSLFELSDEWGNPIAYFHHRDYGRQDNYVVTDSEEDAVVEQPVKARMKAATKTYANPTKYQLISAGADGKFGTEDDITNFKSD